MRELLAQLVAFDTTSTKSNLELIAYVKDYLDSHGVASTLTPSEDGKKASMFARIGPDGKGGIGLSCHSDCVAVESDPFKLELRDRKLYGRGACDMKGRRASSSQRCPELLDRAVKPGDDQRVVSLTPRGRSGSGCCRTRR